MFELTSDRKQNRLVRLHHPGPYVARNLKIPLKSKLPLWVNF